MKKIMACRGGLLIVGLSLFYTISISAQTLSLNDGSILRSNPSRIGINLGTINYYDNGQMLKNLIGSMNPGFEPSQQRQIWNLYESGTTTTFPVPDRYDGVPANYWAGGTFTVVTSQSGATTGCTGTIASNPGPNSPTWVGTTEPQVTISTPCAGAFGPGDIIVLAKTFTPTPESWWEGSEGGLWGSVSGGGKLTSNTTDLCSTCGTQTLDLDASAAGSSSTASFYFDSDSNDIFVLMNGTFQLSIWAKTAGGKPVMTVSASRGSAGGFNCGTYTPSLNSTWTQYTYTCNASETKSGTAIGNAGVKVSVSGGSAYLDNVSFMKVAPSDSSNPTVFRDEVIDTLKQYAAPGSTNRGVLRYWLNQNAETAYNWTQPDYARYTVANGTGYFAQPNGSASLSLSLEDYLEICQTVGADPYFVVPITFTTTDAAELIEFLAGSSSTTYGARRAALGQTEPWTSVFNTIHLEFGNESWNFSSFAGQALPSRANAPTAANPEYYYDYTSRAAQIFAAMRGAQDYSPSSFDLVLNAQSQVNWSMDTGIARAHPDSIEVEGYQYGTVTSFATDAALWGPAMFEPYANVTSPSDVDNFYQSVHDYQSQTTCGATGTSTCKLNVYEWGQNTLELNGTTIDQTHMDRINAGAGQAVIYALEPLLKMQYYGIGPQAAFSLAEYAQNGSPAPKLWGSVIDMGGATNAVRPTFLGPELVNQSIIGPMYSCPITNNPTYNFAGSANGPGAALPAMTNVPYIYSFCFMNGNQRSIVLINTDLSNSRKVSFAGTNMPTGAVSVRQIAPSSLDALNEAPTGTPTNQTAATVAIDTSSLSSPSSITLPPYSVTALDYTAAGSGSTTLPQPTFSPAGGTYTGAQTVSISDSTAGATVYYTTDGSTPTTSSAVYGSPVAVGASETLNAIAVESGYTNSPVASAAYTISSTLPTPVISPSGGSYTSSQTVSISDSATGTTIYYTTNGSTPTTSSSVYGGPITVSASETLNAIAVKGGSSNSAVASAAYTINSTLPAPVISPSGGTYTSTQTVSISDSTTGTTIYYTTNGSTPTTSSSVYGGSITVSASETVNAIAVKSGSSNSAVASAAYTINSTLPTPVISPSGGTYTSAQSVSISDSNAGTTIFYTTDGSTPTTSSSVYGGSITVSASETVNAIAVKSGSSNSAVASAAYTINSTLPAPVISPSGGTYTSSQTVSISDATTGTTIYYTTNGSTPTTSSSVYGGPITVSASETLNAIAVKCGSSNSAVASAAYTINSTLPAPVISPSGGTYSSAQTVSISDSTTGTTIYYTTDGSTPTTSSAIYGSPLTVSASETVNAIAGKSGSSNSAVASAAYTINSALPPPTFNPGPGTYPTSQSVSIAEGMTGSTIYYTTDGSVPTTSSHVYTSPVMVEASTTMKAVAVKSGHAASAAALASYTIQPILPSPSFSPASGTFSTPQTVSISDASAGTTIYYTINGTPPTTSSALYTGPVQVDASETLQAIAVESGHTNSKAATAAYTIGTALSAPTFLPGSGTYNVAQVVTLSEATAGATIYYTTNGSTPTTSSPVYSGPITVSSSETIKATAIATGYSQSGVSSAGYTIRLKKTPKVKLAASSASVSTAEPLNIVVQVSSDSGQPTPTGTVSLAGGEFSSTAVLANGIATISVPAGSLPQGKDTLTGTYTPDAASSSTCTDATSTAVITVIQANYTLAGSALALAPGQSAKAPVTVSSTSDFTGSVSLSCSVTASPAGAVNLPTCAGSNSTVSLDSSKPKQVAYVALNTTAPENLATTKPNSMKGFGEGAALALLALFGIPAKRRKIQSLLCVLILAGLMGGVVGCGGTVTHNSTPGSSASQGTTAGDYTITVTGTGSDSAKSKASATFTLTVN